MKRTILVTGATGAQGGSVARHLLNANNFTVRCLTRNRASDKAIALQNAGAEIVEGDLDNKQSLIAALHDCYGVFGVTNFWEHFDREWQQGQNLIDAVVESGVPYFIFSTLPNYNKLSKGQFAVPHCDIKSELEDYARARKKDTVFIHVSFYYENFFTYFQPQKTEEDRYVFSFPQGETKLAAVSVEDMGGIVAGLFLDKHQYQGQTISIVGDDCQPAAYAATLTAVTGKQVEYKYCPHDIFANLGFAGAEELANMFEVQRLYVPEKTKEWEQTRKLYRNIKNFEMWAMERKDELNVLLS